MRHQLATSAPFKVYSTLCHYEDKLIILFILLTFTPAALIVIQVIEDEKMDIYGYGIIFPKTNITISTITQISVPTLPVLFIIT